MDGWLKKHRMINWLRRLFIAISLMASCHVKAIEIEYVAPLGTNYLNAQNNLLYSSANDACAHMEHQDYYIFYGVRFVGTVFPTKTPEIAGGAYSCDFVLAGSNFSPPRTYSMGYYLTEAVCPSPTINPSQVYHYDVLTGNCSRTVQSNLVITLSGGSEIEPSKGSEIKTLPIIASVVNQNTNQPPTTPVTVKISVKVDPTSGGHDHGNNTRPRGGIAAINTCTSDGTCWSNPTVNGAVAFNFNVPEASGMHTITATCDGCSNTATKTVYVKVTGLEPMAGSILYTKIMPNADINHPNTNYLTTEAMARLKDIGLQYSVTGLIDFGMVLPPLQINDASLKWGGILDCFLTCINSKPWGPSHEEHRKGTVVDIRANGGTGSIPTNAKMTENFIALTRKAILSKYPESTVTIAAAHGKGTGRHFHVRLLGRKE